MEKNNKAQSGSNVLIVDDEEVVCEFLTEQLKECGVSADYLCRMEDVLECARDRFDYTVVIIDLILKDGNGIELIRHLKKANQDIIFIIITGYPDIPSTISAIKEDVFDFITKPFNLEEIMISVRNAIERCRLIHENRQLLERLQHANYSLMESKIRLEKTNETLNLNMVSKEKELVSANQALEDRKSVEIAKGILMKKLNLSEDDAMKKLQSYSRHYQCKIATFALSIIESERQMSQPCKTETDRKTSDISYRNNDCTLMDRKTHNCYNKNRR